MYNLLKMEYRKLFKSTVFKLDILILLIISFVYSTSLSYSKLNGCKFTGSSILHNLLSANQEILIIFLISLIIGTTISNEFSNGGIKKLIVSGKNRNLIILSKSIVCYSTTFILGLIYPLTATAWLTLLNGFGNGAYCREIIYSYFLLLIIVCGIVSIAILLSYILKSVNYMIITILSIKIITGLLNAPIQVKDGFLITLYTKTILYQSFRLIYIDDYISGISLQESLEIISISFVTIAIMTALTMRVFKKSEIK